MRRNIQEPSGVIVRARADLRVSLRSERGTAFHFIEDPLRNQFYRLGKAEFALFEALDGNRSLEEAVAVAATKPDIDALNFEQALSLTKWLVEAGLASSGASQSTERIERRGESRRWNRWKRINPWFMRLTFGSPEPWLNRFQPLGEFLFGRVFLSLWLTAAIAAVSIVAGEWQVITAQSPLNLGWRGGATLLAIWCLLKVVHETAHALACRHVGGTVGNVGIAFVLGMPSPFVEVSSVWKQRNRNGRILVSLAGVYVETFLASLSIIVWQFSGDGIVRQSALATAMIAGASTLIFNLNPLMRFDGYFALADWVDVSNLSTRAAARASQFLRRHLLGADESPTIRPDGVEPQWLVPFGLATMFWRLLVVVGMFSLALYKLGPYPTVAICALPFGLWARKLFHSIQAACRSLGRGFDLRRFLTSWCLLSALIGTTLYFYDPRTIEVSAVVDYEPLSIVRTSGSGFVREVFVEDGDYVEAGRPIIRLENEELTMEFEQTRLGIQQHLAKARIHRKSGALAKEQSELLQRDALEVKFNHLASRMEHLVVRAPVSGRIVSRGIAQLPGRWLTDGSDVVALGSNSSKHVVAALPQSAAVAIGESNGDYRLRLSGSSEVITLSALRTDPRAGCELIHPALSIEHGGDIPIRRRDTSPHSTDAEKTAVSEFHKPHFRMTGTLEPAAAERLYAGRTATLSIRTTWRGAVGRSWAWLSEWLEGKRPTDAG